MFRIWIYLSIKDFFLSCFKKQKTENVKRKVENFISHQSNKKFTALFSQCRVAFYFILKFLKKKSNRDEIIFCAYNLPEMVNIASNLKFKIKFCDLNYKTGTIDIDDLKKNISKKTLAVVLTNMFNDFESSNNVKKLVKKKNIFLIEDNAIYFDNYTKINGKTLYSGSLGDFSIFSFNIMKNISSLYGGATATDNSEFIQFYKKEEKKLKKFFYFPLLKQATIFLILKIMSVNFLFKHFFVKIISFSHKNKISFILKLFYPSLRSIKMNFPRYYFTKISNFSINATFLQLKNKEKRLKLFNLRKKKHKYYSKFISKLKTKYVFLIKTSDKNYQNFLDFPLLVKNKDKLNKYLLDRGIEVRLKHYYNCARMFNYKKKCLNAERYERELICFPVHKKISVSYIENLSKNMNEFFSNRK